METQKSINEWQDATFPTATAVGVARHLMEELLELRDALQHHITYEDNIGAALLEAADVMILIYAWAHKQGIEDFNKIVDEKMAITGGAFGIFKGMGLADILKGD